MPRGARPRREQTTAIHLDVLLDLQDKRIRQQSKQISNDVGRDTQRAFDQIGQDAGEAFAVGIGRATPKVQKAASRAAEAARVAQLKEASLSTARVKAAGAARELERREAELDRARSDGTASADALAKIEARVDRARFAAANSTKQAIKIQNDYAKALENVSDAQRSLAPQLTTTGNAVGGMTGQIAGLGTSLGRVVGPVGIGLLVSGVAQLGGVAASASQSIGLLPGVLGALGAGFGVAKVATMGFGDALENIRDSEKFAESLASLSPNAQAAAVGIRGLLPAFDELKTATQDAFFENAAPMMQNLATAYAPTLQDMSVGVAGAFNSMFSGVADQLMTPETQSAMQNFMGNVSTAFQNLTPALAPLTQAFTELTSVGSDFLPEIASAATEAAKAFGAFITEASRSGDLSTFISDGIETLKQLVPIVGSLTDAFMALGPAGEDILPDLAAGARALADAMPAIVTGFTAWSDTVGFVQDAVTTLLPDLSLIGDVAGTVADFASGSMDRVVNAMNRMLEPIRAAIDLANLLPGIDIANIPSFATGGAPQPVPGVLGGGANASRQRRGLAPVNTYQTPGLALPGGIGGAAAAGIPTGSGWVPSSFGGFVSGPPTSGGGSSGSGFYLTEEFVKQTAANFGLKVTSEDRPGETGSYHSQGMALDLSNGSSNTPQMEAFAEYMSSNFGSDLLELIYSSPTFDGNINDGVPHNYSQGTLNDHENHVHVAADWGREVNAPNGTGKYDPIGAWNDRTQRVSVQDISTQAANAISSPITNHLDPDLGLSKGLSGLAENLFKFVANLAMAPVLGALSGVTAAYGSAGPGTGILGAFSPRSQSYSSGGYSPGFSMPTASTGMPGLGTFSGAPMGSPASGRGLGPLPGPLPAYAGQGYPAPYTPGVGVGSLATGLSATPERGIIHGQGVPASEGIGLGGGIIGAAMSAGGGAAGMAMPGGSAMAAGAQIGIDLINRTIGLGGQLAGNAVGGIMETFLPVESELADPSRGWFGKVLGAVAGVRPAGDNLAGQLTEQGGGPIEDGAYSASLAKSLSEGKDAAAQAKGDNINTHVTVNNHQQRDGDATGRDVAYHAAKAVAPRGGRS